MKSIRTRLLAFLLPVTLFSLVVTGVFIERAVRRDLGAARDRQLLLLGQGIGGAVEVAIDGTVEFDLEGGDMPELERTASESFYAVASEEGDVLFSSAEPPPGLLSAAGDGPVFLDAAVDGESLRVCLITITREAEDDEEDIEKWREANPGRPLPELPPRHLLVAVGQPDEALEDTLLFIRRRLAVGFGFLGCLLVLFPVWAAGFSLGPLKRLSRQADQVGAESPGVRLEGEGVDREVRSLVAALNRALDRLGGAFEQQKRFTADAAHELRSPLSAIRTECEVALRRERPREELAEVLRSVHRVTLRMGAAVENLLSLARLQNGKAAIEKKEVDLARTTREAVSVLEPLARSRETSLQVELPGNITVSGDGPLLLECISNILDNAIRYTPPGGKIVIEGGGGARPWISVSDTGEGIPADHLEKIFDRFHRVDPARSRSDGHSGLGLSISMAIARLHGAAISVESAPGKGSRFTLSFEDTATHAA